MLRILDANPSPPTAVATSNDLTAIGAISAIHERGLRIPEDISIVGFDGIELSAYTMPALTTLSVSRAELAALAFRCLYQPERKPRGASPTALSCSRAWSSADRPHREDQAYSCLYPIGVPCRLCSVV